MQSFKYIKRVHQNIEHIPLPWKEAGRKEVSIAHLEDE
jgi:hypothetical protein